MRVASLHESLTRSLERQRKIFGASVVLTPVDSVPLAYDEQNVSSFLQGFYISDKRKSLDQQRTSIILSAGREQATRDLQLIHMSFAEALGATDSSLRLLSGLHAHVAVFMSLASIGDSVLLLPELAGGHFATKSILERLGLRVIEMPVDLRHLCIDRDGTRAMVNATKPDFIFVDRSEGLRYEDFCFLGEVRGPVKIFDASQYLPQIICGKYRNPLSWGFDLLVFTLHKSFPGSQKAGIACRVTDDTWQRVVKGLGDLVSSSHPESTYRAALALAKTKELNEYTSRMLAIAIQIEEALSAAGVPVFARAYQGQAEWPSTHHIWLPMQSQDRAFALFTALARVRIQTNYRLLPYGLGWGIRMGTTVAATMGLCASEIEELAHVIQQVHRSGSSLKLRHQVRELARQHGALAMTSWPSQPVPENGLGET